jgi:serine/threonine-protein kinase RsbW
MHTGAEQGARDKTFGNDSSSEGGPSRRARWTSLHKRVEVRLVDLRWRRRFTGTKQHVRHAREFVELLLADCPAAQDAAWIVGELATNAIAYSQTGRPDGSFEVEVSRGHRWTEVCVIDQGGDGRPVVPSGDPLNVADELPEGGLGLYGVGMLAIRYGTCLTQDGQRVVWARLLTEPRATMGAQP